MSVAAAVMRGMKPPGVITHDPAGVRNTLYGIGLGTMVAGGAGAYEAHAHRSNGWAIASGAAGGAVGIGLVAVGRLRFAREFTPYLDHSLHASMDDALTAAASGGYNRDIGIHKQAEGQYGLLDLGRFDVDNNGPASVDLGNQHVSLDAIRTRDHDVYQLGTKGDYTNTGVRPQELVDISGETQVTPQLEARLNGAWLGTDDGHHALTIGARMKDEPGFATRDAAEQWGFERSTTPFAPVKIGDTWHNFEVSGPTADGLHARGRTLVPFADSTVVDGTQSFSAARPGDALAGQHVAHVDVTSLSNDDVRNLTGRRLAIGSDGTAIRVGAKTDEFPNLGAAEDALWNRGGEHLLVNHPSGVVVYDVGGASSAIDDAPSTLLAPDSAALLFRGAYTRGVEDRALTRIGFQDVTKVPLANAATLTGQRIAGTSEPYVRLGDVRGTFSTAADADKAAHDAGTEEAVVQMQGGWAVFALSGGAPRNLEAATRLGPDGAVHTVLDRKTYATAGPDWRFDGRSVPLDPNEVLGFDLEGVGKAVRYLGPVPSGETARDTITDRVVLDRPLGAVQGANDTSHMYELDSGSHGPEWDRELGPVDGAAVARTEARVDYEEHKPPYPYQNYNSAYVEELDWRHNWVDLHTDSGTYTRREQPWYVESQQQDWSRTMELRNNLHNQYNDWRRQNGQPPV
jgi:hypothetical protein